MDLSSVDLITLRVRTDRLVLRPYRTDDVDAVFRACQDAELQRWLTGLPVPYERAAAEEFVSGIAPRGRAAGTDLSCAVEADGELVGSCGLRQLITGRLGPELGYWIAPWARRRGYAAEAARGLAEWAIGLGAARVHLFADVGNHASHGVARRAGFVQEGIARSCLEYRGGVRGDAAMFARLAGD